MSWDYNKEDRAAIDRHARDVAWVREQVEKARPTPKQAPADHASLVAAINALDEAITGSKTRGDQRQITGAIDPRRHEREAERLALGLDASWFERAIEEGRKRDKEFAQSLGYANKVELECALVKARRKAREAAWASLEQHNR